MVAAVATDAADRVRLQGSVEHRPDPAAFGFASPSGAALDLATRLIASINTAPGQLFSVKDRYRNCLRINCGIPWSDEVSGALQIIGQLARKQLG